MRKTMKIDWRSLHTRLILGVMAASVVVLWGGTLLLGKLLRGEMEQAISTQQYSVVSLVAGEVDRSVRERQRVLEAMAAGLAPALEHGPAAAQRYLQERLSAQLLFNWGVIVTDRAGVALASVPEHLERVGVDYGVLPVVRGVLESGQPTVTDPIIGKRTSQPVVSMVQPVRGPDGQLRGVVMGVTNLALPNFLDEISSARYGVTGEFLITSPQSRSYVASSDGRRTLRQGPPAGVNPVYDRYIDGYEGSGVARSSRGVVELSSSRRIPSTGWLMQTVLPADEAFAPVYRMELALFVGAFVLSVLLGGLCWWWLRRQLHPLAEAAAQLNAMRAGQAPRRPLPVRRDDEIGVLAQAFNGMLETVVAEEARAAEHAANERLRKIVSHVPGGVFQYRLFPDGHGCFPFASEAFRDIYGVEPDSMRDSAEAIRRMLHPDDRERFFASLQDSRHSLGLWRVEYRILMADGRTKWLLVEALPEEDVAGAVTWYGFIADITRAKEMEAELRVAATTFMTQEGIVVTNPQGVIQRVNPAFTQITGYSPEEVLGRTPALLKSGRHDQAFYQGMWAVLAQDNYWQGEMWNRRKDGELYVEWLTITAVRDEEGRVSHYVGTFQDITARKDAENEIRHLAFYDPLTALPNRRLLLDRLQQGLVASGRRQRHGALLFLDLDNFKTLNDTLGHDVGDELLVEVAHRLRQAVRGVDTVARLGGDEFVVMLEDLASGDSEALAQAEVVAEKILAALNCPYRLGQLDYHGTPSIGVTLFLGEDCGVDELLKQADLAMYQAKNAGRNTVRFFDPAMQDSVNARSRLEAELHRALVAEEFVLFYQPQVDARGHCCGLEALLRWQHPQHGLVPPARFIPVAEESGLIQPIGHWVLFEACRQLARWQRDPATAGIPVAVNVSARQFRQPDFVERVEQQLAHGDFPAALLKLEITESLLLADVDDAVVRMCALRDMGVGFALDDFGTGYSSLAYLKRLPIDQVKIDRSFVRDVLTDPNDAAICRAVIALGRSLGLGVIAEGVETPRQWAFLREEGCQMAQGYLHARPMPPAELGVWLQRYRRGSPAESAADRGDEGAA